MQTIEPSSLFLSKIPEGKVRWVVKDGTRIIKSGPKAGKPVQYGRLGWSNGIVDTSDLEAVADITKVKLALAPALFSGRGQKHNDVSQLFGMAVDIDCEGSPFFTDEQVEILRSRIPNELQANAWLVRSNGLTLWFFFSQLIDRVDNWRNVAFAASKIGEAVTEGLEWAKYDRALHINKFGEAANRACHPFRVLSFADKRGAMTQFMSVGQDLEPQKLFSYLGDYKPTAEFVPPTITNKSTKVPAAKKSSGGGSNSEAVVNFCAARKFYVESHCTEAELVTRFQVTAKEAFKIVSYKSGNGDKKTERMLNSAYDIPSLPPMTLELEVMTQIQAQVQKSKELIAWVGWFNYFCRSQGIQAPAAWEMLTTQRRFKQLSDLVTRFWKKEHFEQDFERCKLLFDNDYPSEEVSPFIRSIAFAALDKNPEMTCQELSEYIDKSRTQAFRVKKLWQVERGLTLQQKCHTTQPIHVTDSYTPSTGRVSESVASEHSGCRSNKTDVNGPCEGPGEAGSDGCWSTSDASEARGVGNQVLVEATH